MRKGFKIQGETPPLIAIGTTAVLAENGHRTYQATRREGHVFNKCLKQALCGPKNECINP